MSPEQIYKFAVNTALIQKLTGMYTYNFDRIWSTKMIKIILKRRGMV
jgi:hypothetical protein